MKKWRNIYKHEFMTKYVKTYIAHLIETHLKLIYHVTGEICFYI